MNTIHICFTIDNKYSIHCRAVIASILDHANINDRYVFYIVSDKISLLNRFKFYPLRKVKKFKIFFLNVDKKIFENDFLPKGGHFSKVNYYRLLLPDLLNRVKKVIYLDADVIVMRDISDLWKISLGRKVLAAAKSMAQNRNLIRLKLDKKVPYVNSGVMLMDLNAMRLMKATISFDKFLRENKIPLLNVDQDVINVVLKDKIKTISQKWNAEVRTDLKADMNYMRVVNDPYIIHFLTSEKPWKKWSKQRYIETYNKYRKMAAVTLKDIFNCVKEYLKRVLS